MIILGGLPRSGSTLLSAILRQNPEVDVTPTGFMLQFIDGLMNQWTSSPIRQAWLDQEMAKQRLHDGIRGAVEGYLKTESGVRIEKSRGSFGYLDLLSKVFGEEVKIIAPIRDMRGCLSSMEKLWRNHPEYAGFGAQTVDERVTKWLQPNNPPLGNILYQMHDALIHREANIPSGICFVRYEDLIANPEMELKGIYEYLGWTWEDGIHRFDHVEAVNREHDAIHGLFGDHEVHDGPILEDKTDWNKILGPISQEIVKNNQWFYQKFYPEALSSQ